MIYTPSVRRLLLTEPPINRYTKMVEPLSHDRGAGRLAPCSLCGSLLNIIVLTAHTIISLLPCLSLADKVTSQILVVQQDIL